MRRIGRRSVLRLDYRSGEVARPFTLKLGWYATLLPRSRIVSFDQRRSHSGDVPFAAPPGLVCYEQSRVADAAKPRKIQRLSESK